MRSLAERVWLSQESQTCQPITHDRRRTLLHMLAPDLACTVDGSAPALVAPRHREAILYPLDGDL
jgi:hypothetical protein